MTEKKKAAQVAGTGTAQKTKQCNSHITGNDPLMGWYSLSACVKPSRNNRQQKRGWKRNSQGRIDPVMAANIALLAIVALLVLGVIRA